MELTNRDKLELVKSDDLLQFNEIPIYRKCELLNLNRSNFYYEPRPEDPLNIELMGLIDKVHTKYPFYGYPRVRNELEDRYGYDVNEKRVYRLMQLMGIVAIYPKKNLSKRNFEHKIYPYLLKGLKLTAPNEVWGTDITFIKILNGWIYLVALIDWYSRYVLSWEVSTTLETGFCIEALEQALRINQPIIHNSDQGSQFTSESYTGVLKSKDIFISMDSRGRAFDNIFTERLWRSLKYEEVYLKEYLTVKEAKENITNYFNFYNKERRHQSLNYKTPQQVYFEKKST